MTAARGRTGRGPGSSIAAPAITHAQTRAGWPGISGPKSPAADCRGCALQAWPNESNRQSQFQLTYARRTQPTAAALSISANTILLEAVLAVPCRPQFLRFDRSFTHSDCRGTGIGADRGSAAQRALGEGHASGACSLTTTAGCSRCFSGSAGASVAGASLPRLRRQTWS